MAYGNGFSIRRDLIARWRQHFVERVPDKTYESMPQTTHF